MKKLLSICLILASCGDKSSDPKPPVVDTSKNKVETFVIRGSSNLLPGVVDYFWQRAENSGKTYPKGLTVKGVQKDETDGTLVDNSTVNTSTKTIELDIQYVNKLFSVNQTAGIVHINRLVGKIVAPGNLTCANKITDFLAEEMQPKLNGNEMNWVDTMIGLQIECPIN